MNSPEVKAFIREHSSLFWYIPEDKKEDISHDILVEFILNYGDLDAVRRMLKILGTEHVAKVFFDTINLSERRKGNYHELTLNFFSLFFRKYAHRDSD